MNKKNFFTLTILIAVLFMSIGYASVNSGLLDFEGTILADNQTGVFVSEIVYLSDINADVENSEIIGVNGTTVKSIISLSSTDYISSITYLVTVYNSTDKTYFFKDVNYLVDEETYSNENIIFTLDGLNSNDVLNAKESKIFTITFSYSDNNIIDNVLKSYINFSFETLIEDEESVIVSTVSEDDVTNFIDFTGGGGYENLYGGNNGQIKYSSDGAMVFGSNYPILYKDITNENIYKDNLSVYLTIKADVNQDLNTTKYPVAILSIGRGDGLTVSDTIIWIGLYKGYLHVYTYRASSQGLCTGCNYEVTQTAFISYDVTDYTNKIFNIQVVAGRDSQTYLYINGSLVANTLSGNNDNAPEYISIGDLRPMRNLKYEGYIYDYVIYNRLLTDDEINSNYNYSKNKWSIE